MAKHGYSSPIYRQKKMMQYVTRITVVLPFPLTSDRLIDFQSAAGSPHQTCQHGNNEGPPYKCRNQVAVPLVLDEANKQRGQQNDE